MSDEIWDAACQEANSTARCPKCKAKSQLTLTAANTRIHIVCGACGQWWSIGEIEHTPYFFGGAKASNGPNEVTRCGIKDCTNPSVWHSMCEFHLRASATKEEHK